VHRTTVIEPKPGAIRTDCIDYVDLARRMSIPTDDAIRRFVDTWLMNLRPSPTPGS
jgi:hypothetical protein